MERFRPDPILIETPTHPACRAAVIVPARNEEQSLPATLDALCFQKTANSTPLDHNLYEVILLLNNCTDASAATARRFQSKHPSLRLHIVEQNLGPEIAHVGTARRLLMDTAWHRLHRTPDAAILSTDADSIVAPKWISRNMQVIEAGAEVVGGVIHLDPADIRFLDPGTLHAYRQDRRYQRRTARLESLLDPDPADPWPRHLEHFGASLACTPAVYARAGGLPPVKPLEDVAFIDACRRVDARIRHDPEVSITTSARLEGRAEIGLSGQLRRWQQDSAANRPHLVQSATYLAHRFASLAHLRHLRTRQTLPSMANLPSCWHQPLVDAHPRRLSPADFLSAIDCNRLIDESFHGGHREDYIHRVLPALSRAIVRAARPAPAHLSEISPAASIEQYATLAV